MLSIYDLNESSKWDSIVKSFQDYDVYWLSGYTKAFKLHGDGEPLLFHYDDGNTRGINVVMRRDIANDKNFAGKIAKDTWWDFSTPYGYGGWLIEGTNSSNLFEKYEKWCRDNNIVSEFVRYHPVMRNHELSRELYDVVGLGYTVTIDLKSPETIWSNITSKNRNMIRKALKNRVKIYHGNYPEVYALFKEIYDKTMDKDNANEYYYFQKEFYESILKDLFYNAEVFYAEMDNKVIAASIVLIADGKMNYHLSGSDSDYAKYAPTNLLLYEASLWGCAHGFKTFYLGGGVGSGEDNLYKFKKSFYRKDDLNQFYIGKKIFNNDKYTELGNSISIPQTGFFPEYRAKE